MQSFSGRSWRKPSKHQQQSHDQPTFNFRAEKYPGMLMGDEANITSFFFFFILHTRTLQFLRYVYTTYYLLTIQRQGLLTLVTITSHWYRKPYFRKRRVGRRRIAKWGLGAPSSLVALNFSFPRAMFLNKNESFREFSLILETCCLPSPREGLAQPAGHHRKV